MALCFAHTAAGYLAYEVGRPPGAHRPRLLAAAVLLANAPDLDFVPGLVVGAPGAYHRGVTHTLAAVVVVGVAVALTGWLARRPYRLWTRAAVWASATYASHLLLDYFTTDAAPPYGGRFLWPLSNAFYLAPVTPLGEIIIDPSSRAGFLRSLVGPHTFRIWGADLAVLAFAVGAVQVLRVVGRAAATVPAAEKSSEGLVP